MLSSHSLFEASSRVRRGGCVCWGAHAGVPRVCDGSGGDAEGAGMLCWLLLGL